MNKHPLKFTTFLLIISILTIGCDLQEVYVDEVSHIELTHLSSTRIGLNVYIPIHNPNNINFKITGIDLDVLVNGSEVGKITNSGDVKILKKSSEVYPFPVDVKIAGIVKSAMVLLSLAGKDRAVISVQGDLEIKYPLGKRTLEVASENEVRIL